MFTGFGHYQSKHFIILAGTSNIILAEARNIILAEASNEFVVPSPRVAT